MSCGSLYTVYLKYLVELLEQFLCLLGGNEFLGLFRHLGGQLDTGLVTLNIAAFFVNTVDIRNGKNASQASRSHKRQSSHHLSAPREAAHRAAVIHGEARNPDISHRI